MNQGLGFEKEALSADIIADIETMARQARGDILTMTTLAASGHPGGSMSSIDIYATLYACAQVSGADPYRSDRDRVVISHGHTSPGVYATLAAHGFVDREAVICGFRQAWSPFEGHIEREVPGVEWSTGNLGQGLSAACGMALASRLHGQPFRVFVVMGDGEQAKGQLSEARRFAVQFKLTNLVAVVDYNELQISGNLHEVMENNIAACWAADGWEVVHCNGHDIQAVYQSLRRGARATDRPVVIVAHTVMGKGVPFMENLHKYHGVPLTPAQHADAMSALDLPNELESFRARRPAVREKSHPFHLPQPVLHLEVGTPRTYGAEVKTDNRSAFGTALEDLGRHNISRKEASPLVVFDCDLAESTKTGGFRHALPERFYQAGIQEHHTAVAAGALSTQGAVVFWSEFGVFGVDETYNQQRLNDINRASLKTVCTHCGLDVGEDGKTHQGIDYIGVMRNTFHTKVIVPADPNETDRVIRYMATQPGGFLVALGRSKVPVILDEAGQPFFGGSFTFEYGKAATLREGTQATIMATGTLTNRAVKAWELLKAEGISARVVHVASPLTIDMEMLQKAMDTGLIVTVEDHHVETGLGCSVALAMVKAGRLCRLERLGVTDYQASGPSDDLFARAGLDAVGIARTVKTALGR